MTLGGLHTDILLQEFLSGEILHEVFAGDETTLLIGVFEQDLVQALDDGLHDFLEAEMHRLLLFVVLANVLAKLLVNLLDHTVEPVSHIGVRQFDLLVHLSRLVVLFLGCLDLAVQLVDVWVGRATHLDVAVLLLVRVLHLQLVEFLCDILVIMAKAVQLLLVVADSLQQLRVGGLSCEELGHNLLNIGETGLCPNLLEGLLDLCSSGHLFVHFCLQEASPEFLGQEVLVHLELVGVFVVIGCLISDLLLAGVSLDATLQGSLLVVEGL